MIIPLYHAEKNYSEHVFESLLSETKALLINIEELLYEFAGTSQIVTAEEIKGFMKKASVPIEEYDNVIELLCEHTFLGLETKSGNFVFQYEPVKKPIIQKLAENVATSSGKRRYKINIPFHRFLEITK